MLEGLAKRLALEAIREFYFHVDSLARQVVKEGQEDGCLYCVMEDSHKLVSIHITEQSARMDIELRGLPRLHIKEVECEEWSTLAVLVKAIGRCG